MSMEDEKMAQVDTLTYSLARSLSLPAMLNAPYGVHSDPPQMMLLLL